MVDKRIQWEVFTGQARITWECRNLKKLVRNQTYPFKGKSISE